MKLLWVLLACVICASAWIGLESLTADGEGSVELDRGQGLGPERTDKSSSATSIDPNTIKTSTYVESSNQHIGSERLGGKRSVAVIRDARQIARRLHHLGLMPDKTESQEWSVALINELEGIANRYEKSVDRVKSSLLIESSEYASVRGRELGPNVEDAPLDPLYRAEAMKPTTDGQLVLTVTGSSPSGEPFNRIVRINNGDHKAITDLQFRAYVLREEGAAEIARALSH